MPASFPEDFLFGTATSSYQIEGSASVDGRGEGIWDHFSHQAGNVAGDETGDVAADHYRRFPEDVALLTEVHAAAYRFSISWPRIIPAGKGAVNSAGLDFYDRLVDELLENGIEPWPCFFHWDLPQALQDRGGWAHRDIVGRFSDFVSTVAGRIVDRTEHCLPLNEPSIFAILGHLVGHHAPGLRDLDTCVAASHHLNLATAAAARALRSFRSDLRIGNALALNWIEPGSDSGEDRDAAARRRAFMNDAFLQPFFDATYPEAVEHLFAPYTLEGDLEECRGQMDFIGVNYYTRLRVTSRDGAKLMDSAVLPVGDDAETTEMGWEIYPNGLRDQLIELSRRFPEVPLYVTENGVACPDKIAAGTVADSDRIAFLRRHLEACLEAIDAGANLRGYFVWSLLDNFEWAEGYEKRFGLVHVDDETQERIPKESYAWFGRLAQSKLLEDSD